VATQLNGHLELEAFFRALQILFFNFIEQKKLKTTDNTGGPCYMQEIGTPKIGSHLTNLNMKKTKDYCKSENRFQKRGRFWIAYTRNRR